MMLCEKYQFSGELACRGRRPRRPKRGSFLQRRGRRGRRPLQAWCAKSQFIFPIIADAIPPLHIANSRLFSPRPPLRCPERRSGCVILRRFRQKTSAPEKCLLHPSGASVIIGNGSAISGRTWQAATRHAPVISALTTQHSRTKRLRRSLIIPIPPPHCKSHSTATGGFGVSALCPALIFSAVLSVDQALDTAALCFRPRLTGAGMNASVSCGPEETGDQRRQRRRGGSTGLWFAYPFAPAHA